MTKAEQEALDRQKAWEEDQAANHGHVTLPRSGEPGAPDHPDFPNVPATSKKKSGE
jgi:hypothetical protein